MTDLDNGGPANRQAPKRARVNVADLTLIVRAPVDPLTFASSPTQRKTTPTNMRAASAAPSNHSPRTECPRPLSLTRGTLEALCNQILIQ
ncbi:hypothetical protein WIMU106979_24670 [Williamsia muralis]